MKYLDAYYLGNYPDYLDEMIKSFNFYDFISNAKYDKECSDYKAFIIISGKQYIIGYTSNYGRDVHLNSIATAYLRMHGMGEVFNVGQSARLSAKCEDEFICGYVVYELTQNKINDNPKYNGRITFEVIHKITSSQYESFLKFYEKYNDDIDYICSHYGFSVELKYNDENGRVKRESHFNLDLVKLYLHQMIDETKVVDDNNEKIVGVSVEENKFL